MKNSCPLFNCNIEKPHDLFTKIQEDASYQQHNAKICEMWDLVSAYTDTNFPAEFQTSFHQRFWELYLGYNLRIRGCELVQKEGDAGPDFQIRDQHRNIWIEAVAPEAGCANQPDHVPNISTMNEAGLQAIHPYKTTLRYTTCWNDKTKKIKEYKKKGIIGPDDAVIIAISSQAITNAPQNIPVNCLFTALFGINSGIIDCYPDTNIIKERQVNSISKQNGASVPVGFFTNEAHADISAVIYGDPLRKFPTQIGDDLLIIHNPMANQKISLKTIERTTEYYCRDEDDGDWSIQMSNSDKE